MIIQRNPKNRINSIADVIWYVDENLDDARRNDTIAPTGHIHIVYNFKEPYFLLEQNRKYRIPDKALVGQYKKAMKVQYSRKLKQLGLAIRPSAFYSLFREVCGLYSGAIIDCSGMPAMVPIHKAITSIVNSNHEDGERVIDEIEQYFESYNYINTDTEKYENMITYMEEKKGLVDVGKMADIFGFSISSLERNFKKYLGLTPKAYADILRFRYAVMEEDPISLFYDQSHFIKNCQKYTNKIPRELSESEDLTLLHILEMNKS